MQPPQYLPRQPSGFGHRARGRRGERANPDWVKQYALSGQAGRKTCFTNAAYGRATRIIAPACTGANPPGKSCSTRRSAPEVDLLHHAHP